MQEHVSLLFSLLYVQYNDRIGTKFNEWTEDLLTTFYSILNVTVLKGAHWRRRTKFNEWREDLLATFYSILNVIVLKGVHWHTATNVLCATEMPNQVAWCFI